MSDSTKNIIEFTLVYNQLKRRLYNYALKMLNDRMMCEDVIQNVFMKYFENMYKIKNLERTDVWLFKTTRNEIYTIYRNKKVHVDRYGVTDLDDVDIEEPERIEDEFELKEIKELIMKQLDQIPIEQKDLFLLKEYGGFSYKEIASLMDINEELVKSRLFKVRQKLIHKLSKMVNL